MEILTYLELLILTGVEHDGLLGPRRLGPVPIHQRLTAVRLPILRRHNRRFVHIRGCVLARVGGPCDAFTGEAVRAGACSTTG